MLQQKIRKIFKDLPNVFGIEDDILIAGYDADGRDHDRTLRHIIQICLQEKEWQLLLWVIKITSGSLKAFRTV